MTYEIKVRKWLWIALVIVVILGGGFTYWNVKGSKKTASVKTSPTPTKSSAISPSAGATATPTSGKTATPAPTVTPISTTTSNNKYEGYISDSDLKGDQYCNFKISFDYPNDYSAPSLWVGTTTVSKDSSRTEINTQNSGIFPEDCSDPIYHARYSNPSDYFNSHRNGEILEGPTEFSVNGLSGIRWTQKYMSATPANPHINTNFYKIAFIMTSNTKYVKISTGYSINNQDSTISSDTTGFDGAFDTVVNSFNFK